MDLTKINEAAKRAFLETRKLATLEIGKLYRVTDLRKVATKYGDRIVADIDETFCVFLPKRMINAFNKDEQMFDGMIEASRENILGLKYLGGESNAIEFESMQEDNMKMDVEMPTL